MEKTPLNGLTAFHKHIVMKMNVTPSYQKSQIFARMPIINMKKPPWNVLYIKLCAERLAQRRSYNVSFCSASIQL